MNLEQYKAIAKSKTCLVIGDVMLDRYIYGSVNRISPEAPIPIVAFSGENVFLGGAANVANNICKLGANVILLGALGEDAEAKSLLDMMDNEKIEWRGITSKERETTVKTRVIGNDRQVVRIDRERAYAPCDEDEIALLSQFNSCVARSDIVIISDYAKGVCSSKICETVIAGAKKNNKIVIIDPKISDWTRYSGAFLIKPNLREFIRAKEVAQVEEIDFSDASKLLLEKYCISNLLVTKSQEGMSLVSRDVIHNINAEASEVFDVSGAGDSVLATLSVFIAAGMSLKDAVSLANIAAGIAVGKAGAYAVSFDDISNKMACKTETKLVNHDELIHHINVKKKLGLKVVFTNGCFDIIHLGHIQLLQSAKSFGNYLVVGLNSDESVRLLKGASRPINNELDRAHILAALECVDAIVVFDEETPYNLICDILPDVLVKGDDYQVADIAGSDIVLQNGGRVELVPLLQGKSTTEILMRLQNNCL